MVNTCCVNGCTARSSLQSARFFYRIPKIDTTRGTKIVELTQKRRRAWLQQINRKTVTELTVKSWTRVCSKHFLSGKFVIYPSLKWKLCLCRLTRVDLGWTVSEHCCLLVSVSFINLWCTTSLPRCFEALPFFLCQLPSLIVDRQTFFRVYHPKHQSVLSVNDKMNHMTRVIDFGGGDWIWDTNVADFLCGWTVTLGSLNLHCLHSMNQHCIYFSAVTWSEVIDLN